MLYFIFMVFVLPICTSVWNYIKSDDSTEFGCLSWIVFAKLKLPFGIGFRIHVHSYSTTEILLLTPLERSTSFYQTTCSSDLVPLTIQRVEIIQYVAWVSVCLRYRTGMNAISFIFLLSFFFFFLVKLAVTEKDSMRVRLSYIWACRRD